MGNAALEWSTQALVSLSCKIFWIHLGKATADLAEHCQYSCFEQEAWLENVKDPENLKFSDNFVRPDCAPARLWAYTLILKVGIARQRAKTLEQSRHFG